MSIHTYNVKAAELEVRNLLESALAHPSAIYRCAYLSQTAIILMDDDHRAAVLLFPELVGEIRVHIGTAMADLDLARATIGEINYRTYKNLLDHAESLLTEYTPADDCDSYFTADLLHGAQEGAAHLGHRCTITSDGEFAEPAGRLHPTLPVWVLVNSIPHETVVAHIYDTKEDGPDYGHHGGW
jgi:hypothetical protein